MFYSFLGHIDFNYLNYNKAANFIEIVLLCWLSRVVFIHKMRSYLSRQDSFYKFILNLLSSYSTWSANSVSCSASPTAFLLTLKMEFWFFVPAFRLYLIVVRMWVFTGDIHCRSFQSQGSAVDIIQRPAGLTTSTRKKNKIKWRQS